MNFRKIGSGVLAGAYTLTVASLALTLAPKALHIDEKQPKVVVLVGLNPIRELEDIRIKSDIKKKEAAKPAVTEEPHLKNNRNIQLSRGDKVPVNIARVLDGFQVTWYNNDGISHTTKSGAPTVAGQTVSVDPRIIPLGTWIEICMPDGRILKRKAEDTGSAVHGRVLDVYADQPASELNKRGRTFNVTVRILKGE